jgi:hypothetical protein
MKGVKRKIKGDEPLFKMAGKNETPVRYPTKRTYDYEQLHFFGNMRDAFECAGTELVVFTKEMRNTKRSFIVTGWRGFDNHYFGLGSSERLYHEMMRPHQPCRVLYVDLDCNKQHNPHIEDYSLLIREVVHYILDGLDKHLNVDCEKVEVLYLEASNDKKFSVHLLFEIENTYWRNHEECLKFVKRVLKDIPEESIINVFDEVKSGVTGEKKNLERPCIDAAIYHKHKTLRMYGSGKFMEPGDEWRPMIHKEYEKQKSCPLDRNIYHRSLITKFPRDYDFRRATMLVLEDIEYECRLPHRPALSDENGIYGNKRSRHSNLVHNWFTNEIEELKDNRPPPECENLLRILLSPGDFSNLYGTDCWKFNRYNFQLTAGIKEKYCAYYGGNHAHNNSQFVFDLREYSFYRRCFSEKCKFAKQELQLIENAKAKKIIREILDREKSILDEAKRKLAEKHEFDAASSTGELPHEAPVVRTPYIPDGKQILNFSNLFSGWKKQEALTF